MGRNGTFYVFRHWCTTSPSMVHFEKNRKKSQDIRFSFKTLQCVLFQTPPNNTRLNYICMFPTQVTRNMKIYFFTSKDYLLSAAFNLYGGKIVGLLLNTHVGLLYLCYTQDLIGPNMFKCLTLSHCLFPSLSHTVQTKLVSCSKTP